MLQFMYHDNFKGGPTLLLAGSGKDIGKLLEFFKSWSGTKIDLIREMGLQDNINVVGLSNIFMDIVDANKSSIFRKVNDQGFWSINKLGQSRIIGLLAGLEESEGPGHQYLDDRANAIKILCSKDEYSEL